MKEKFLPIGTVVLLTDGTKEVMITSYCIFPKKPKKNSDGTIENKIYEYGGCIYPEGILDTDTICAFNHDQISKICFMGYETQSQKDMSAVLNKGYEIYKAKYMNENNK